MTAPSASSGGDQRADIWVHGLVQGVGFRWWTRSRALELGLVGSATNTVDGRVHVVAEGPTEALDALVARLRSTETPGSVSTVVDNRGPARGGISGFVER